MRKLDICVPHYMETPEEMEPLLDSIKLQHGVDLSQVGVIIAFDGPEATELPLDEWRERYPFAIEDVHPPKGGVSAARNAACDASTASFVQFFDADDCICDACGLYTVMREMDASPNPAEMAALGVPAKDQAKGFDFMISCFREETMDQNGNLQYINHEMDSTFVHGKVARRQWLVDNNLRFGDDLQVHEDSFWVIMCRETAAPHRAKYNPMPWVLWVWRKGSVCRADEKYILKTLPDLLKSNAAVVRELIRRGKQDRAAFYFAMITWEAFFTLNKQEWRDSENKSFRDVVERKFAEYFRRRRDLWDSMDEHEKAAISNMVRQRSIMEGMLLEAKTVSEWLSEILAKYPE